MTLEDNLRWAEAWTGPNRAYDYDRPRPAGEPNWRWLELWMQENPRPDSQEDYNAWHEESKAVQDRIWVAWCLPQFKVWDWPNEDVEKARALVARHVCGVCGRSDDSGCWAGC